MSKKIVEEEFSIPLNVSEILDICHKYSTLPYGIQNQIRAITDLGVEEAIETNLVKRESLPFIAEFLGAIQGNVYFGDAANEAKACLYMLETAMPKLAAKNSLELN